MVKTASLKFLEIPVYAHNTWLHEESIEPTSTPLDKNKRVCRAIVPSSGAVCICAIATLSRVVSKAS